MNPKTIVHVVDDNASFCKAISRLLRVNGYEVLTYRSAEEFLSSSTERCRGCILMDIRMPGISGLQAQALLANQEDPLPIIFITGHGDIPMSVRAMKEGAENFLTKPIAEDYLLAAIESALAKYDKTAGYRLRLQELRKRFSGLTERQVAVFRAVVAGKPNKVIASELDISEGTVKAHRYEVMEKMHAMSLVELVDMARAMDK